MAVKVTDSGGKSVNIAGRGRPGSPGADGKSAYQYAVAGGYTGTEEEFQALMGSGPWVKDAYEEFNIEITNPNFKRNGSRGFLCRKLSDGTVFIRMNLINTDLSTLITTNQVVATLPEGYRPSGGVSWVAFSQDTAGRLQGCIIDELGKVSVRPLVGGGYNYTVSTHIFVSNT